MSEHKHEMLTAYFVQPVPVFVTLGAWKDGRRKLSDKSRQFAVVGSEKLAEGNSRDRTDNEGPD